MAIEKSLSQAPLGVMPEMSAEPDIEIEIEDPESVKIGIGDLEIEFEKKEMTDEDFNANLVESMDDEVVASLAGELIGDYDEDVASRKDWIQTYVDGLELLGMKLEDRAEPWEGACGVYHPLLSEALVKFQSETMMSTFPASGPVKTQIIGKETPEKKESAKRVQDDMNYQLMDVMKEYRPEHERMLWGLGLSGNAFKKVYYDPSVGRQVSIFVPAEDIVVPYGASDLESAERVTHVMRKTENELRRLQVSGFYADIDLGPPNNILDEVEKKIAEKLGFRASTDSRYKILEMHVELDLPGHEHRDEDGELTGIALPYVVTIEKGSNQILAIRRNWEPDDETYAKRQHFVHYGYVPGFGFYYFGLIHLVGAFAKSGTSLIRQLVDAGTLANLPGGFKARGLRVKGDDTPIAPGEFRDVDVPSGSIKDNLMPLPYKEPSQTLFQLFQNIIDEGRRFANTADLQISDMSAQAPVGTTLAILERTLKTMSAVQARVHYSMKQELGLLKQIIAAYTPDEYSYEPVDGHRRAKKTDYDDVDVIPVSDPNASTMAQKIVQYQAVMQLAQAAPQLYNLPLLHRQMLDVLGIKDAQKLVPMDEDQKPADPVTENQNILRNKPVKAFAYQDHRAHITVHMSAMQDPMIQQLLKDNPMAGQMQAAMMNHINDHLGMEYRKQIELQLGFNLPPKEDEMGEEVGMNPEVEARLAPMLAQAAQRLLSQNQAQVAQQQAQQQAQDPIIQMQQQELAMKQAEIQRKAQKDMADIELRKRQQEIEAGRIISQAEFQKQKLQADSELEAIRTAAEMRDGREKEIIRMGVDIAKQLSSQAHQKEIQQRQPQQPKANK
jgi:chaperonin GroES